MKPSYNNPRSAGRHILKTPMSRLDTLRHNVDEVKVSGNVRGLLRRAGYRYYHNENEFHMTMESARTDLFAFTFRGD
jgi:hypothetical protein